MYYIVISKIYNSKNFWFKAGGRKGKGKKWIEKKSTGQGLMVGKVGKAHKNLNQHTEKIKKLTNKERLERIKNNSE
tara:strand:- start:1007 stop:1234 length:228 start_codon:yes stop_codon:yes gene_type:complete